MHTPASTAHNSDATCEQHSPNPVLPSQWAHKILPFGSATTQCVSGFAHILFGNDSPAAVILLSKYPVFVIPYCQNILAMIILFSCPSLFVTIGITKTSFIYPPRKKVSVAIQSFVV